MSRAPCTLSPPQLERTRTCRSDATRWRAPTPTLPALSQLAARGSHRLSLFGSHYGGAWAFGALGQPAGPYPYRTLRQTLQICRRRMPHAVCVHARPAVTAGPPCPGRPGRRGRRLFPVVWPMTQSRQAGVDCSGRAHVNFASNRASVGSGRRPLSSLGNTAIRGGHRHRPLPRNPSTRPLNHSTTQPPVHPTTQHPQATPYATLTCLPWIAAPTTTYCSYQHHCYPLHKSAERTVTRHCSCSCSPSPSPNQDACTMSVIGPSSPPTPPAKYA
jgi:hypothetical protein